MVDYSGEEEQIEAIRRWWRENGRAVVLGILIGLAALGSWRGWMWYRSEQGIAASQIYQQMLQHVGQGKPEAVLERAKRLRNDYAATPYAPLAALAAGRATAEDGDKAKAAEWLRWAVDNGDDAQLQYLARARLARVLAATDKTDQALKVLDAKVPSRYTVLYAEIRGDVLRRQGDREAAASAYRKALNAEGSPANPKLLRRKLNRVKSASGDNGQANGGSSSS